MGSQAKVLFLALVHQISFLLLRAEYKKNSKEKFKQHPHVAKAFSYPKHIYKHVEHHGKLTFLEVIVNKPKST